MQCSQDARHGNRKDTEDAVPSSAHNQQHHNGDVRPWGTSCRVSEGCVTQVPGMFWVQCLLCI